ncbi:MAG: molybdopterin molybdotransferase MoeA [Thermoplasmata archaeon]|jgi:molybdenum cofactor synthesis domain-containing protein
MEMHAFGHLTPVDVARRRLLKATRPIDRVEQVRVECAFQRVLARNVRAPVPVPSFPRTTWDGYAFRSRDTHGASHAHPAELRVVGEVFAEQSFSRRLRPGEAVAIATGGAIPQGADAVVIFEEVDRRKEVVRIFRPIGKGDRISTPGHDFPRGTLLGRKGEELTAPTVGAIAACGIPKVSVYAAPRVAVIPNGNELLSPGDPPAVGRIYESNNATIASVILAAGGIPEVHPPVPDDPVLIERALRAALARTDLVLATGGSSVGERDHLPRILPKLGRLLFHGIAVRAGKPTLAARAGRKLVIGMPGHPTSCLANMYWLVLPALRRLGRRPGPGWTDGWAVLGSDAAVPTPGLATIVPLRFEKGRAYTTYRGSSVITSLAGATAFAMIPPGRRAVHRGERVRVHYLDPPLGPGGPRD